MKVLLGVSGGIAAYKSVEILRSLQQQGAEVDVLMTRSARRFVTPLTFSALTGKPVLTGLWTPVTTQTPEAPIEHITLAQSIDVLLIAPATANTLARLAHGSAADLLSTVYLATRAPVVLAPAMNVQMWRHPATEANLHALVERGASVVAPESGYLACGMTGTGRLADVEAIVEATLKVVRKAGSLAGETVLVTAGGTREAIDPVRYLGNRSSGRMGHALAAAAQARGAKVILITASSLAAPPGAELVRVDTAEQMGQAIDAHLQHATLVFAAAAVADFRPRHRSETKLRRERGLVLELEPTPDLVARMVAQRSSKTLIVAFAAEMDHLEENGRVKLIRKGADALVANSISEPGIGFESDSNAGLFLTRDRTFVLEKSSKRTMADRILDQVIHTLQAPDEPPETLANLQPH